MATKLTVHPVLDPTLVWEATLVDEIVSVQPILREADKFCLVVTYTRNCGMCRTFYEVSSLEVTALLWLTNSPHEAALQEPDQELVQVTEYMYKCCAQLTSLLEKEGIRLIP